MCLATEFVLHAAPYATLSKLRESYFARPRLDSTCRDPNGHAGLLAGGLRPRMPRSNFADVVCCNACYGPGVYMPPCETRLVRA